MNAPFQDGLPLTPEEALRQLDLMSASYTELSETLNKKLAASPSATGESLAASLTKDIRDIVLSVLKLDQADFSPTTPLMDYGLDSIAATEIGNLFTSRFNIVIPPTVFFEFQDLKSFVNYLTENYAAELQTMYPQSAPVHVSEPSLSSSQEPSPVNVVPISKMTEPKQVVTKTDAGSKAMQMEETISIESLWQMTEAEADPVQPNDVASPGLSHASVPVVSANVALQETPEVRQPSRELLNSMKTYADRALIHTITRANKRPLEYATYGEGSPLLMLGGLLMHYSVMWLVNMKDLGEHHKLIMFHMPGCGGLDLHEGLTLQSIADDIADVLDAQGITEPLPVFGCSFGGVMAQAFVLAYPERCSALAVTVSTPFAEGATDFQLLMKELQVSSRFMELNRGWPMASLPAYEKVIEGFDFREPLKKLDIPSLIVAGGRDRYTTPGFSRMMAASLRGARLVEFPDAGHLLTFSHHEEFNRLLIDFLAEVGGQAPKKPQVSGGQVSAFLPATENTLDIIESYVRNGQQGHCVILSEHAAQLALTLNVLCNQNKTDSAVYRSYFLTSLEEAFDAAIRLSRHHARNKNPKSDGKLLIIDPSGRWSDYFDPLKQGQSDALVPGILVVGNLDQAEDELKHDDVVAVALVAEQRTSLATAERFIALLKERNALSILLEMDDHNCDPDHWISCRLTQHPDLVVFGEGISGFQAPVGAMLVHESVTNPWLMTPSEGYVRQPMASFGLTVKLAFEYLNRQLADVFTPEQHRALRQIAVDQESTYQAHMQYGNIGYAKVANMHGFDARFFDAYGLRSRIARKGEPSREILDCLSNVGCAPRGLNPQDVVENVLHTHDPQHDYWGNLAGLLKERTGFSHTLPASSQTAAIETALTLAHMAAPRRKKALCFAGGAGFSLLSANSAMDTLFDLFRKPFQPLYPYMVFIDPASENAAEELERELLSGELAFVWLETIQVEGNAVRLLPRHLIELVERHRTAGGYLIAIDETQTSVSTGKFLHSNGLIGSPDIVALAMSLTDSIFPIGAVLATDKVVQLAEQTNAARLDWIRQRGANQLSAHVALNSLQQIDASGLMEHAAEMGAYLKSALHALAQFFPLISNVRGEGLVLAVEFDLDGYDPFIQQSFGYFLWGAMLRDQEYGVAVVVCPVHNRSIRIMPPLTITKPEADILVANLRRRLTEGVGKVFQDCAAYALKRGDERLAGFLSALVNNQVEA